MIRVRRTGEILADRVEWADSFGKRFLGLMGRAELPSGDALVLEPCQSVHMLFMRFPLDVAFVEQDGTVVAIYRDLRPWRLSGFHKAARYAVELPVGALVEGRVEVGDVLEMERASGE